MEHCMWLYARCARKDPTTGHNNNGREKQSLSHCLPKKVHAHILNCLISSVQFYLCCGVLWSGGLPGSCLFHPFIIKGSQMRTEVARVQLVCRSLWLIWRPSLYLLIKSHIYQPPSLTFHLTLESNIGYSNDVFQTVNCLGLLSTGISL